MDPGVTFLTKNNIKIENLLKELKQSLNIKKDSENQKILNEILEKCNKNDFSFLSPQEIHMLKHSSTKTWPEL